MGWAVCSDGLDVAGQLHLQIRCHSHTGSAPYWGYGAGPPQTGPSPLVPLLGVPWRAKVKLAFTTPSIGILGPPLQCVTACAGRRPLARDSSSVSRSSHLSQARLHHAGTVQVHPSRDATFAATFDLFRPTNRDHLNLDREFHLIYLNLYLNLGAGAAPYMNMNEYRPKPRT